jgi:hypothetical protein
MFSRRWSSCALFLVLLSAGAAQAQTVDDGVMMPKKSLCTGFIYSDDKWDEYWEGGLKRTNGNIGTVTTSTLTWMATYGLTDRLNVMAALPYVSTNASQGVLHGQSGVQDVSIGAKYRLLSRPLAKAGSLRVFASASAGTPTHDYTPDFQPLSIGLASSRSQARGVVAFQSNPGFFVEGTTAYTWRGKVTLDRPFYFTNGEAVLSDEVAMPNVFDYTVRAGYAGKRLRVPVSYTQQYTRGGGDIRRQDAPFVSNRMNFSRVEAKAEYMLPVPEHLQVQIAAAHVTSGRNVGQSTTISAGLLYNFHF